MRTLVDKDVNKLVFYPPELGCALYLPGLPGGGSKIYDISPYGNIGTITGATWKRLPNGLWCLSFDGTDDKVDLGLNDSLVFGDEFSTVLWVYPEDLAGNESIIHRGWRNPWSLYSDDGQLYEGYTLSNNNYEYLSSGVSLTASKWQQVALTHKLSTGAVNFYLNAARIPKTATHTGSPKVETYHVELGGQSISQLYQGGIALVLYYPNRILTHLEIINHFNREKHLFGVW